jgi:hypothetical protein
VCCGRFHGVGLFLQGLWCSADSPSESRRQWHEWKPWQLRSCLWSLGSWRCCLRSGWPSVSRKLQLSCKRPLPRRKHRLLRVLRGSSSRKHRCSIGRIQVAGTAIRCRLSWKVNQPQHTRLPFFFIQRYHRRSGHHYLRWKYIRHQPGSSGRCRSGELPLASGVLRPGLQPAYRCHLHDKVHRNCTVSIWKFPLLPVTFSGFDVLRPCGSCRLCWSKQHADAVQCCRAVPCSPISCARIAFLCRKRK